MRRSLTYQLCLLLIIGLIILDMMTGSVPISISQLIDFITGDSTDRIPNDILVYFRIPKILTAILVGIFLPISGLLMQTFFRNPIAGPYILGISSGASLGVAVVTMLGFSFGVLGSLILETVLSAFWVH